MAATKTEKDWLSTINKLFQGPMDMDQPPACTLDHLRAAPTSTLTKMCENISTPSTMIILNCNSQLMLSNHSKQCKRHAIDPKLFQTPGMCGSVSPSVTATPAPLSAPAPVTGSVDPNLLKNAGMT